MTLKVRFAAAFAVYTAFLFAAFSAAYYVVERRALSAAFERAQAQAVEKLSSVCRLIHTGSSAIMAVDYVNTLKRDPLVFSAACYDAAGRITAHTDPARIGAIRADAAAPILLRTAPVMIGGSAAGSAEVAYDTAKMHAERDAKLSENMRQPLLVSAAASVAGLLLALVLSWSLSRPILALARGARAIGDGDLDFQTPYSGRSDEVGALSREMASMAGKLKALDQLKDDFINHVSHDLRNPMAAIDMYAQRLLETPGRPPEESHVLGLIRENAVRLGLFVGNMLDAAKMKAGRMEFRPEPVALEFIVSRISGLLKALTTSKKIELTVDVPAALMALADPEKLESVVANVLSNAVKFSRSGGRVSILGRAREGRVELVVTDSGRGIPKSQLDGLFRRFHQAKATGQDHGQIPGSGLGLFIVKRMLEGMNGEVLLESEEDRGTTVTIRVPAASDGKENS